MAFFKVENIRIAGFSACVPQKVEKNLTRDFSSEGYTSESFIKSTGVFERHYDMAYTASDLGIEAAKAILHDLGWDRSTISAVIFVSQTPDYILPATSCIIQDKLGLSTNCYAEDISLGCSGWVYGLSTIASLLSNIKGRGLLICGDARPTVPQDNPLFGCACSVTALEYREFVSPLLFSVGTDGSGYESIIIPDGGSRNGVNAKSFNFELVDGKLLSRLQTRMNGIDIFSFGVSQAPLSINSLIKHFCLSNEGYDYLILHQANKAINDQIVKKLKIDSNKSLSSLKHFGNTSSASIPLTIVTELRNKEDKSHIRLLCCGFGVGLSWGSVFLELENVIISELIEL